MGSGDGGERRCPCPRRESKHSRHDCSLITVLTELSPWSSKKVYED